MKHLEKLVWGLLIILTLGFNSVFAGGTTYSAFVVYGENLQMPMPEITANLYNANGDFVKSTITDSQGVFTFDNLNAGETYSVRFVTNLEPFGVDMADAYLLLNYLNGNADLSALQLQAADVNGDSKVDFADFEFLTNQWYLSGESFPAGDWVFPVWSFTPSAFKSTAGDDGPDGPITIVSKSDISNEGVPVEIKAGTVIPAHFKEFQVLNTNREIEIPFSFANAEKLYGMGLHMAFNSSDIQILSLSSQLENLNYVVDNNSVKLSWLSAEGESFAPDQNLFSLKVRINAELTKEAVLEFIEKAQFVGEDGSMLEDVAVNMPKLKQASIESAFGDAYPNPANKEVNLVVKQLTTEPFMVEIYNLSGQRVKEIQVNPLNQKVVISTADLANGSYLCAMNINQKREVKMIRVQH
jgi:hypothetical protein